MFTFSTGYYNGFLVIRHWVKNKFVICYLGDENAVVIHYCLKTNSLFYQNTLTVINYYDSLSGPPFTTNPKGTKFQPQNSMQPKSILRKEAKLRMDPFPKISITIYIAAPPPNSNPKPQPLP